MGDYISREAAKTIIERLRDKCGNDEMAFALNWASRLIRDTPAADVLAVVRCRECWHHRDGSCMRWADGTRLFPDDYCSRGIRVDMMEATP